MTKEELLKERYKMIADYPGSPCYVGDILTFEGSKIVEMFVNGQNADADFIIAAEIIKYPHLFRKMEWWEERKESEMPLFLKDIGDGEIFKVREWLRNDEAVIHLNDNKKQNHTGFHQASAHHFLPSDESEYNQYIQKQA